MQGSNPIIEQESFGLVEALERVRPEMQALAEKELKLINLDPLASVCVARGALPRLMEMRDALSREFQSFDIVNLDRLELYAFALTQAQIRCQSVSRRSGSTKRLERLAQPMREQLLAEIQVLILRGLVSPSRLTRLRGRKGCRNLANDLLLLTAILRDVLPGIVGKTAVTRDELDAAESLGNELVAALGGKQQLSREAAAAADDRQRVFTLFVRAYGQVRRAVTFVRWDEGDVDRIAPSLFAKNKTAKRGRKPEQSSIDSAPLAEVPETSAADVDSLDPDPKSTQCASPMTTD
jgi:hypothetical protein